VSVPALPVRQNVPHPGLCFGAGLLLTLVLGVGLGALNLFKADWSAGAVTGESVLVHAHAQIFGFVVLFVIGIVGHALPRLSRQPLPRPWLLWLAFGTTLAAQLLFPVGTWGHTAALARAGEALDLAAALVLTWAVFDAVRGAPRSLRPWLRLGSLALVVSAAWGLAGALDQRLLLQRPALWQLALWCFIAPFIFGMSWHILDMAGGFDVRAGHEGALSALWALAVGLSVLGLAGALPAGWLALGQLLELPIALAVASRLGVFRRPRRASRGAPFFASAYGWLLASLALSALVAIGVLPDHLLIEDVARHTFTIGCVTQMIIGVALRALPVAGGVELAYPVLATAAYFLLNGAVVMRLARLWAALVSAGGLWVSGVSGFVAFVCLLCFGASLLGTGRRVMARHAAAAGGR
jgi:hypothetical protein